MRTPGEVHDRTGALEQARERRLVDGFQRAERDDVARGRARQRAHLAPAFVQARDQRASDETRRAGHHDRTGIHRLAYSHFHPCLP